VIGEAFGFTGERLLFSGNGKRRERFDCLPGTQIDEGVIPGIEALTLTERQVRHRTASQPGADKTKDKENCGNCDGEPTDKGHRSTLNGKNHGSKAAFGGWLYRS
jgi:hypothetical protein